MKKKSAEGTAIAALGSTLAKGRRLDPVSEAAVEVVAMEQSREQLAQQEQVDREQRIAQTHEFVGRIQGMTFIQKVTTVGTLVQLKQIKEAKTYRDLPNLGTWEKFCEYIGLSRQKVDEDLANLSTFGEDFLTTVSSFSLGYRELRKLRQLTADGTVSIDEAEIVINGERIPFTPEHRDDLQTALECVIETNARIIADKESTIKAKDRILKSKSELIEKQARELSRLEDNAAFNGMTPLEEKIIQDCDNARTTIDGFLLKFDPDHNPLPADATPRMMAAYLGTLGYFRSAIIAAYDHAEELYANGFDVEHQWTPPHLRKANEE